MVKLCALMWVPLIPFDPIDSKTYAISDKCP